MSEQWKPIDGFNGRYEVSDQGRVRTIGRVVNFGCAGPVFRPSVVRIARLNRYGYLHLSLRDDNGRQLSFTVHRLVATAFCNRDVARDVVRHLDGNKLNNAASNLAWGTHRENEDDKIRLGESGKGSKNQNARLTERDVAVIKNRLLCGDSPTRMAREFGVCKGTIFNIKSGLSWSHVEAACPQAVAP